LKLSIVIIHYDTSDDLERCLLSIRRHEPSCGYGVIVVDNASTDPGLAAVREAHPDVRWIMNEKNVGYSRGVNLGIAAADADYYLVLNPDIVVRPGALDALLDHADRHPRGGLIGPQLLNEDGSVQDSCRRFYTLTTLMMRRTFLGKLFPKSDVVDRHLMRDFDHASNRSVDWVLGGCMLVRREALARVGPMDERFFLYFEDVDWCYRMGQAGWDVLYTPEASFIHRHRRDSAKGITGKSFWLHLGSLVSFFEKWSMLVWVIKRWRDPMGSLLLWLTDAVALNAAFAGAWGLRALLNPAFSEPLFPLGEYRPLQLFATLLMTLTFAWRGRYRVAASRVATSAASRVELVGVVSLLLLASTYLSPQDVYSRAVLLLFVPLFAVFSEAGERLLRRGRGRMEQGWLSLERCLLVGDRSEVEDWLAARGDPRESGLDTVGWLRASADGDDAPLAGGEIPCLGEESDLADIVERYRIAQVVFWRLPRGDLRELRTLARLRARRIRLHWNVPESGLLETGARSTRLGATRGIVLDPGPAQPAAAMARRIGAVVMGAAMLVLTALPWGLGVLTGADRRKFVVAPRGAADGAWSLSLLLGRKGAPRPAYWQAPLAWSLITGRLELKGPPLVFQDAVSDRDTGGDPWRLEIPRAGLLPDGTWSDPIRYPAGLSGVWHAYDREE